MKNILRRILGILIILELLLGSAHTTTIAEQSETKILGDFNQATQDAWNVEQVGHIDGTAFDVAVSDDYAYIAMGEQGMLIYEISNPATPDQVGSFTLTWGGNNEKVLIKEERAFVCDDLCQNIYILSLNNPENPVELGVYRPLHSALGFDVNGNYLFASEWNLFHYYTRFTVTDLTDPLLDEVYEDYYPEYRGGVYIKDNYMYVSGFQVLDISVPTSPIELGYYPTSLEEEVEISGNYAYLAGYDGLEIVDISNPYTPIGVKNIITPGDGRGISIWDSYAFIADGYSGLRVFNMADPQNPYEVGYYLTGGYANKVLFSNGYIFLADKIKGLYILQWDDPSTPQIQKQKGISFATWGSGQYSHPGADLALENLADTGANWISLIVTQYQDNISSTVIYSTTATPTDSDLIHVITQAHSLGLKVMLKPHVDLASDPTHWRGQIGQSFTETEWNAWFTSYQGFIYHYAQLAQTYGVDQFSVGTELSASQSRANNWRVVITGVRNYYSGPLTYAANHSDETNITWWDAVDYIGVDAYYPLTSKNDPTVAELKTAWQPHVSTLGTLASTWNKSIIFTEIGYRSQDGTNQHPWDWQIGGTVDLQEQADTYQAAFESVFNQSWFAGVYWWAWETDPFQGGLCDYGYSPYEKPAEDVLRSWYGAHPRVNKPPPPQPDYSRTLNVYTDGLNPGWENWSWDANVDLVSDNPVYSGTQAISITAQAWGALSLHHSNIDSTPYYWLELYVRKSSAEQQLRAFANDENDVELRYRPVDDCRYTDGQPIQPLVWTPVRIPLSHLDASGRLLQRVSIKNYNSQPSSFWIDEIRLVGASWHVYLPTVIRGSQ